ncbi:MAG: preprotein translocase subunit YajC [Bacteroidales bacterium]|nr:preprotein translocase subunit YajC [Bacteroidales bacterium]
MSILTILQAVEQTVPQATSQAADGAQQMAPAGGGMMWIMLILIFVVMWFFMIRPQRKQQKELQKFREGLKKGDKVVTAGGIYGTVDQVNEKSVLIKVDGETKLRVAKESLVKDFSDVQQQ